MIPGQYYRAHCGCKFFPCGGGGTQHTPSNVRQHRPSTSATSGAPPFRPYDPANTRHNPLGRIGQDQEGHNSASSPPADRSSNTNAGEGPSSSNIRRNQAAYESRLQNSVISLLADRLRRWPTNREIEDHSARTYVPPLTPQPRQEADPLPNLFDINRTRTRRRPLIIEEIDPPEPGPRSRTSRRRSHAEAFGTAEPEPPVVETQRRPGSTSAQQGSPRNYQPPAAEDVPGSPMAYRPSTRRQTNQPSNATALNPGEEAPSHHTDLHHRGTENQPHPWVRSGNASSRGAGGPPYSPGPRRRHGRRRRYSPYRSSSSDGSRNFPRRPWSLLRRYVEEEDGDDDDDGHHTY